MASSNLVAVVTGSNKGIGLACIRQLALQYPKSLLNTTKGGSLLIYLTARNRERGETALRSIQEDQQLSSAKALRSHGGSAEVKFLTLDIDSDKSIDEFASTIKKEHPEGIDILINNAGVALNGFDADVVRKTLRCNYFGTLQLIKTLLPSIRDGGRIVNVASMAGVLTSEYSKNTRARFTDAKTVDEITQLMRDFTKDVEAGDWQTDWPSSAYKVSKAGVVGMTKIVARDLEKEKSGSGGGGRSVLVNVCCPGYVNTDMTKGRGVKTVDEGAKTPVLLALGEINGANGQFWQEERPINWVSV